jgi:hypothetical protein
MSRKKDGQARLTEECNTMARILKDESVSEDSNSYVQAPVSTPDDVRGFISMRTSGRSSRLIKRLDTSVKLVKKTVETTVITPGISAKRNEKREHPPLPEYDDIESPQRPVKMDLASSQSEFNPDKEVPNTTKQKSLLLLRSPIR